MRQAPPEGRRRQGAPLTPLCALLLDSNIRLVSTLSEHAKRSPLAFPIKLITYCNKLWEDVTGYDHIDLYDYNEIVITLRDAVSNQIVRSMVCSPASFSVASRLVQQSCLCQQSIHVLFRVLCSGMHITQPLLHQDRHSQSANVFMSSARVSQQCRSEPPTCLHDRAIYLSATYLFHQQQTFRGSGTPSDRPLSNRLKSTLELSPWRR